MADTQGLCQIKAGVPFALLQPADVLLAEAGDLGKLLLCQAGLFPDRASILFDQLCAYPCEKVSGRRSASPTLAWVKPLFLRAAISCSGSRRWRGDRRDLRIRRCLSLFRSRIEHRCRLNLQHRSELLDHVDGSSIYTALKSADVGSINTSFMCQRLLRQLLFLAKPTQIAGKDFSDSHTREATLLLRISPRSMLYKLKEQFARAPILARTTWMLGIATSRMRSDDDYRSWSAL
ncbi:hypothetical protein LCM4577_33255 [Mesorhizobium sp. LCM 4577]|nr:hypothetical protein LCM4577_33255 [Mesorhizobium sp. LCM 4577]